MSWRSKLLRELRKYDFHDIVTIVSVLYLLAPLLLFSLGWLKPGLAVIAFIISTISLIFFTRRQAFYKTKVNIDSKHKKIIIPAIILIVLVWVLIAGIGGYGYQNQDYDKHNAVASDLITHHWPVKYDVGSASPKALVYYPAYYLPTAAVGKVLGTEASNIFSIFWATLGILLCAYWLFRLVGQLSIKVLLIFIFFSGLDIAGYLLIKHGLPGWHYLALDWYATIWQYYSITALLNWSPQHAIGIWIVTAMTLAAYVEKRPKSSVLFIFSLGILFSPLACIGLVPVVLLVVWSSLKNYKSLLTFESTVFPVFFGLMIGLYTMSGTGSYPSEFIWHISGVNHKWLLLIAFIVFDFGIYAALLYRYISTQASTEWRRVYWVMVAVLIALPFYKFGFYNDLEMRASIPMLFILCILVIRLLLKSKSLILKIAISIALLIGAINPLIEFSTHLSEIPRQQHGWGDSLDGAIGQGPYKYFVEQYYGDPNSFFFVHLARD